MATYNANKFGSVNVFGKEFDLNDNKGFSGALTALRQNARARDGIINKLSIVAVHQCTAANETTNNTNLNKLYNFLLTASNNDSVNSKLLKKYVSKVLAGSRFDTEKKKFVFTESGEAALKKRAIRAGVDNVGMFSFTFTDINKGDKKPSDPMTVKAAQAVGQKFADKLAFIAASDNDTAEKEQQKRDVQAALLGSLSEAFGGVADLLAAVQAMAPAKAQEATPADPQLTIAEAGAELVSGAAVEQKLKALTKPAKAAANAK